jgi:hypothetical protein
LLSKEATMTSPLKMLVTLFLSLLAGCGGGGSAPAGPAGVDGSQRVASVSDADKASLCDWYVAMVGGYGAPSTCAYAVISAPPDKASCTMQFPVCAVTVSQFEDCVTRLLSAQNVCTQQAVAAAQAAASCQAVGSAGCFN